MRLDIEQAQFENGKQSAWTGANNQHIGFDRFAHLSFFSVEPGIRPGALGCACLAKAEQRGKP
jgi:hypothetical protein